MKDGSTTYTDVWEGHVTVSGGLANVFVVGTVGDVGSARTDLINGYHGNLCVYKAKYSMHDLQRIAQKIQESHPAKVHIAIDPTVNKVAVTALALDPPMAATLAMFDPAALAIEKPLLLPVR